MMMMGDDGGDGGGEGTGIDCTSSGMGVEGNIFSWGPDPMTAHFQQGISVNILGCPNVIPDTGACGSTFNNVTEGNGIFCVPIPNGILGKSTFFQFQGNTVLMNGMPGPPVFNMLSGPFPFAGGPADKNITRHAVINQPGGIRDTISGQLTGVDLSNRAKWSWIFGAFVDSQSLYTGSQVTISSPPEAKSLCQVYYTCEFVLGGPCSDSAATGSKFIQGSTTDPSFTNTSKNNAFIGNYLVICDISSGLSGNITMSASQGTNPSDMSKVSFSDQTVPVTMPGVTYDMVFSDWAPM
jgi:hypothetical protein